MPDCRSVALELDAALADHISPALALGCDQRGELFRRTERQLQSLLGQALAYVRRLEGPAAFGVEPINDRARRAGGRHEAEPGAAFESGEPDFRRGRDLGQRRITLRR